MSEVSKLTGIPYPSENDDPWFQGFQMFVDDVDVKHMALFSSVSNILIPPPSVLWNGSSGQLTWDDDFVMPILSSGFLFSIQFGPDQVTRMLTLNDGDKVIITAPYASAKNTTANFSVISGKVSYAPGLFIFGMRYGTRFICNIPQVFT